MPFCPNCEYEYTAGIATCPDCGADLVEKLSDDVPGEIDWVKLHPLPGTIYAEMVKEVLDQQGIPNIIRKTFMSSAIGATGSDLGGLETVLLVPKERVDEAESILHQMMDHI